MTGPNVSLDQARAAMAKLSFGKFVDVVGVGIAKREGGYVVRINVRRMPKGQTLPSEIDGVPVIFEVIGTIRSGSLFGAHRGSFRMKSDVDLTKPIFDEETDAERGREIDR